ncbi:hypothetical protein F5Y08DRAFT_129631 [Xylaria arbuscula]|nr:hypothetical protein F5Y08DRAFT_129631 [Xylaria arbuscula]
MKVPPSHILGVTLLGVVFSRNPNAVRRLGDRHVHWVWHILVHAKHLTLIPRCYLRTIHTPEVLRSVDGRRPWSHSPYFSAPSDSLLNATAVYLSTT